MNVKQMPDCCLNGAGLATVRGEWDRLLIWVARPLGFRCSKGAALDLVFSGQPETDYSPFHRTFKGAAFVVRGHHVRHKKRYPGHDDIPAQSSKVHEASQKDEETVRSHD